MRVMLVDNLSIVRDALREPIEAEAGTEVVATRLSGSQLLRLRCCDARSCRLH